MKQVLPDVLKFFKDKLEAENDIELPIPKCLYTSYTAGTIFSTM